MPESVVALAMPRGTPGVRCAAAAEAFYRASSRRDVTRLEMGKTVTSLAIRCFNLLWCQALEARREHGVTHFAMIHDDVCPAPGWLDVLLEEMERTGADLVSAVVPIKSGAGLTSTAVDVGDPWVLRRLALAEVFALPETFGTADVAWAMPWARPGSRLLLNTGLWVCRFDRPWVEDVCFRDHARVARAPDGTWCAQDVSEDWDFSRQLHGLGLDLRATRKVALYHERAEFHTRAPWGAWRTDEAWEEYRRRWHQQPAAAVGAGA